MPNIHDLKRSNFMTKNDVEPPVLVTIAGYEEANVAKEGASPEMRWTIKFRELEKPLVLNSTNGQIIAQYTKSDDFDGWIGKQIVIYFDPNISFGGKLVGGIRVRAPRNALKAAPTQPPSQALPKPQPAPEPDPDQEADTDIPF